MHAEDLVAAARRIAQDIAPTAAERDAERSLPHQAFEAVRQARIGAARVPRSYGGIEAGYRRIAEAFIALARGDSNVAQAVTMGGRVLYESLEALVAHAFDGVAHATDAHRGFNTRRSLATVTASRCHGFTSPPANARLSCRRRKSSMVRR